MAFVGLPRVNTHADVTGHTHPPSTGANTAHYEDEGLSHLQNLVSSVPLHVVLRGFADEGLLQESALVTPQVRRSLFTDEPVRHLDIVSCWKGLSQSQTLELTTWTRLFRESLASQIKARLQDDVAEQISRYPGPTNEALLIPRMVNLLSREHALMVKVSIKDLVHGMISLMYNTHRNETLHRKFDWSLSSGDLPDFVFNVTRTQDCFHHTRDGSFVFFNLSYSYTVGDLTAFADLHWRLPRVTFSALPRRLVNGQMYRINPHFVDASSSTTVCSGFSARKDDITYSVATSPLPLQWDFTHDWFHAPVPHDSPGHGEVLETILSAKITTPFHAGIRFERVSRYNIKLEVGTELFDNVADDPRAYTLHESIPDHPQDCSVPWLDPRLQGLFRPPGDTVASSLHSHDSPWVPSYISTPLSKTGRSTPLVSQPAHDNHCISTKDSVEGQSTGIDHPGHQTLHAFTIGQQPVILECSCVIGEKKSSPGKRKGWSSSGLSIDAAEPFTLNKEDRPDPEVDTKRRKLRQNVDSDVVMSSDSDLFSWDEAEDDAMGAELIRVATELMGGAQTSTPSSRSRWSLKLENNENNYHKGTSMSAGKAFPATAANTKRTSFTWRVPKRYSNHSPASSTHSSPVHEITPPITASTTTSASTDALSQEQIQHNYHEFEQHKKQKAADKEYYKATVPEFDGIVSPTDVDDKTFEGIFMGDDEADGWSSDDDGVSQRTGSICLEE